MIEVDYSETNLAYVTSSGPIILSNCTTKYCDCAKCPGYGNRDHIMITRQFVCWVSVCYIKNGLGAMSGNIKLALNNLIAK